MSLTNYLLPIISYQLSLSRWPFPCPWCLPHLEAFLTQLLFKSTDLPFTPHLVPSRLLHHGPRVLAQRTDFPFVHLPGGLHSPQIQVHPSFRVTLWGSSHTMSAFPFYFPRVLHHGFQSQVGQVFVCFLCKTMSFWRGPIPTALNVLPYHLDTL